MCVSVSVVCLHHCQPPVRLWDNPCHDGDGGGSGKEQLWMHGECADLQLCLTVLESLYPVSFYLAMVGW